MIAFLSVQTWSQEEPCDTNRGTVLVSVVYSGSLAMDGQHDESIAVRARDPRTGEGLLLDGVHRRSIEEQAIDMLAEGATREDTWEWVVAQVARTLNRGLYIACHIGDKGEDLEW